MFSVCIVVRDRPRLVVNAVRSVLASEFGGFEVVVVDDGSVVPVSDVLDEAGLGGDRRIHVVRRPPRGIAAARNAAIDEAQGEFVTVLDSDDELAPDALTRLDELLRRSNPDWVYADFEEAWHDRSRVIHLPSFASAEAMRHAVLTRPRVPFKHSGMTVRRDVLQALGGYDESLAIKVDVELVLHALDKGIHPFHLAYPIVRFYRHRGNVSRRRLLGIRTWLLLIDRYCSQQRVRYRIGVKVRRATSEMGKWVVGFGR